MKREPLLVAASALALLSPTASVIAKHASIGIHAIIDGVAFEPDAGPPDSVRIPGVFVVYVPMSSGDYRSLQKGYHYFRIAPSTEPETRRDWSKRKALARSDKAVGFGQH